jgi:hypothetical protein
MGLLEVIEIALMFFVLGGVVSIVGGLINKNTVAMIGAGLLFIATLGFILSFFLFLLGMKLY